MTTRAETTADVSAPFSRSFVLLWLMLLTVVAVYIRVQGVGDYAYTGDEAVIHNMAGGRTATEVWQFSHYEAPSPLGNLLRHYWMQVSENHGFMRAQSLLVGVALIPLYYGIGLLMGGQFCGMACAMLIAFSHGCVIQTYAVRNYCFFIFFLSCTFYFYLKWRKGHGGLSLAGYAICGSLAALTNFTAAFAVLCIAGAEALVLLKKKDPLSVHAQWAIANFIAALAAAVIYYLWIPLLLPLQSYLVHYFVDAHTRLPRTALYPLAQSEYIFPSQLASLLLLVAIALFCLPTRNITRDTKTPFYSMLKITLLSFALGMVLLATNIYPYFGTRRGLWALPFLISTAGAMIGILCAPLLGKSTGMRQMGAMALIIGGYLLYSPDERFHDGAEYAMPLKQWNGAEQVLKTLTASDLIVTERDDGQLLANLYRSNGDAAFSGKTMIATDAYGNVPILYNPFFPRSYNRAVFLANLEEAAQMGVMKTTQRIVFFRTAWSRSPLTDLMLCPMLEKTVLTFPAQQPFHTLTREDIYGSNVSMMLVRKQTLMDDVLAPDGKARACLDGKHDMVPGDIPRRF